MTNIFIENFYDLLAERGLNRKQFAEQCGVPYTTVIGWTADGRLPDFNALMKIADFFDCSVDYLMGRQDLLQKSNYSNKTSEQGKIMLAHFRKMDEETQNLVIELLEKLKK